MASPRKGQNWPWPRGPPLISHKLHVKFESDWAKNCRSSLYCAHKVLYTECQSWPWHLTPWPQINRVLPLIIYNLHVQFESNWASPRRGQNWPWPMTPWPKINRGPPLIIHKLHVKFESDWARRVARRTHGSTCFHIISAKSIFFFIYFTDVLECFWEFSYLVLKNAKFSWLASLSNLLLLIFSTLSYL